MKKQQKLKNGKVRFRLNIGIKKEMEDLRLNAKNNHITVDKIYYLCSLFVFFFEF